jgi:hypothetical protein
MIIIFISLFTSCKSDIESSDENAQANLEMKFDKEKWLTYEGTLFPYRKSMLHDLMHSDSIRSLNKKELLALLGKPSYMLDDKSYLYYVIDGKQFGFWTVKNETLVIKISDADSVEWMKIHK